MNTAANLLVILAFLSAFYTLLGLLCAVAEKLRGLLARRWHRRALGGYLGGHQGRSKAVADPRRRRVPGRLHGLETLSRPAP